MSFKKISIYICFITMSLVFIGCTAIKPITSNNEKYISKKALDKIVKENVEPISIKPNFGGNPFCVYEIIDSEKDKDIINVYIHLLGQEFYVENNNVIKGTGGVFPAIITIKKENEEYKFLNCNISRSEETEQALEIFPKAIRKKARHFYVSKSQLSEMQRNAENYFKEKNIIKS